MKNTKTKLISSVAVLLICFAMLIGSTFAWFTDSASTGVNKIEAGSLAIDLLMKTGTDSEGNIIWRDAEGETLNWIAADSRAHDEIFWEPGATYELPLLKIENKGNLETQFKVQINGITGADALGNTTKLLEVLDFEVMFVPESMLELVDGFNDPQRAGLTSTFNGSALNSLPYTIDRPSYFSTIPADAELTGIRLRANEDYSGDYCLRISAHMKEDANNDYQGLSLDNIGITVLATQCPSEFDSFDNQYDKDALYDGQLFMTSFSSSADAIKFCADCYNNPGSDHSGHNEYLTINEETGVAEVKCTGAWMDFGSVDWPNNYVLSYDVDLESLTNESFIAFDAGETTSWQDLQVGFKKDNGTIYVYNTVFTNNLNESSLLGTLNDNKAHLVYSFEMVDNGDDVVPKYSINMNVEISDGTNVFEVNKSTSSTSIDLNTKLCWDVYTVDGSSLVYATLDNFLFENK